MEYATIQRVSDGWKPQPDKKPKARKPRNIASKTARQKATATTYSAYKRVRKGLAIGWRMNGSGAGTWTARRMTNGKYEYQTVGASDEMATSDGITVFDYDSAVTAAIAWDKRRTAEENGEIEAGAYTVERAAQDWLNKWTGSTDGKATAESNVTYWILPTLGKIDVKKLRKAQVENWLHDIASKPPLKVLKRMNDPAYKKRPKSRQSKKTYDMKDPENIRKRRDSANRIFNDLSAMLTRAYDNGRVASKAAWETVEKFENVATNKNEYLTMEQAQQFLEKGCEEDFAKLVCGGLITGYRYMDLATLKVSAYNKDIKAIGRIQRKTGKVVYTTLSDDEAVLFERLIEGKKSTDLVFLKADGSTWNKSNQQPRMEKALQVAGINKHVRFHDIRHTFGTLLAMNGASMKTISNQLGHSNVRTTENFYLHYSPEYFANEVRAKKPKFNFDAVSPNNGGNEG